MPSGDNDQNPRPSRHPLLGVQILIGLGFLAGGSYLVIDTIRDSSRFAISAGDARIALGGLGVFIGAILVSFGLMPF